MSAVSWGPSVGVRDRAQGAVRPGRRATAAREARHHGVGVRCLGRVDSPVLRGGDQPGRGRALTA